MMLSTFNGCCFNLEKFNWIQSVLVLSHLTDDDVYVEKSAIALIRQTVSGKVQFCFCLFLP